MNIYEVTVRYERAGEKGLNTKVVEQYIIEAKSCAAAELGLMKMLAPAVTGMCEVLSIKRSAVNEIIADKYGLESQVAGEAARLMGNKTANIEADRYYKAKVAFDFIDELTGKIKKTSCFYFIFAGSVEAAHRVLEAHLRKCVMDYEVLALSETKFIDYVHITEDGEAVVV